MYVLRKEHDALLEQNKKLEQKLSTLMGVEIVALKERRELVRVINERDELLLNESKMNGALSAKQEIINGLKEDLENAINDNKTVRMGEAQLMAKVIELTNELATMDKNFIKKSEELAAANKGIIEKQRSIEHLMIVVDEQVKERDDLKQKTSQEMQKIHDGRPSEWS